MDIFSFVLLILTILLSGYLLGSLNWALIVTKYFYHIDIYSIGSGNAGGTNVGRACGKKAAYTVIVLDVLKTIVAVWGWYFIIMCTPLKDFVNTLVPNFPISILYYSAGVSAAIGHTFPIFSHFKGGKAVSCYGGFCVCTNWMLAVVGFTIFLLTYFIRKRVSLASIVGVSCVLVLSIASGTINYFNPEIASYLFWFPGQMKMDASFIHTVFIAIYTILVIVLHRANIKRLANQTEPETHYKKTEKKAK